jgi:hypothetical protein
MLEDEITHFGFVCRELGKLFVSYRIYVEYLGVMYARSIRIWWKGVERRGFEICSRCPCCRIDDWQRIGALQDVDFASLGPVMFLRSEKRSMSIAPRSAKVIGIIKLTVVVQYAGH